MRMEKLNWEWLICRFVFLVLVLSTLSVIIMIIKAPSGSVPGDSEIRVKSDYSLMLLQCILGIIAMLLPGLLEHRIHLVIPSRMMVMYALFLFAAIYLGEVKNFYFKVPNWDMILHAFSGGMLGALGFSFIVLLNNTDRVPVNMSPLFIVVFSFCFAVALGAIWEIYEYTFDGLLHLNMQKFALENGTGLIGREALADTMQDIIVDCIGALFTSVLGYISLIHKKGWIERLLLKIKK